MPIGQIMSQRPHCVQESNASSCQSSRSFAVTSRITSLRSQPIGAISRW